MSNQYFENNPNLDEHIQTIEFYFKKKFLRFKTNSGVFSKNSIDYGTSKLLENIIVLDKTKRILDVGCGYGPIGITIASAYPHVEVDMIDVNQRAINMANLNIQENKIVNGYAFISNLYENVSCKYDMIISNPPIRAGKEIVHSILKEAVNYLNSEGELWIVIQKKQGAESALKQLKENYKTVEVVEKCNGYYIIKSIIA